MIQMLPLLPPDWGTWKWDEGNLSATTEQTQLSHLTLLEKGLCANFSRFVWNDIVDLTANALNAAGIEWDSTYGSVEDCKITEHMGAFMANKFNGVAANINKFGLFRWEWEFNQNKAGYLGRPHVNGASTHGARADNIYAWYILELTDRLNWFLSILKNEADFAEQSYVSQSQLMIDSKLASVVTAPSRSYESILSSSLANARTLRVAPHESLIYGSSLSDGELLARNAAYANSEIFGVSSIDAVSRMIYTLSIRVASLFMSSKSHATLNNIPPTGLSHEQKSTTSVFALMEAGLRELRYTLSALSKQIARVTVSPDIVLCSTPIIESLSPAIITSSQAQLMFANEMASSLTSSALEGLESGCFVSNPIISSYTDAEVGLNRIGALYGFPMIETIPYGIVSTAISASGRIDGIAKSIITAKPKMTVSGSMRYANEVIAHYVEEFRAGKAASFKINQYSGIEIDVTMGAKRVASGTSFIRVGSHYAKPPLVPGRCASNSSQINARGYINVSIEKGMPYPVGSVNKSDSSGVASVNMSESERVVSIGNSISFIQAGLKRKNIERLCSAIASESGLIGEISFASKLTDVSVKAAFAAYAVMENGAEPDGDTWYDPIQTGTDLYIRQTYEDPIQTGTNLDISEVFFEPVIDGSNLHIISAASIGYA